jgi:hypothetical protein
MKNILFAILICTSFLSFGQKKNNKTKANNEVNKVEILSKVLGIGFSNGSKVASIPLLNKIKIEGGHRTGYYLGSCVMEFVRPKGSNSIRLTVKTELLLKPNEIQTENFILSNENIEILKNKGAYGTNIIEVTFSYSKLKLELFNYLQDGKDAISIEINGVSGWKHWARIDVNENQFQEAANYLSEKSNPINIAQRKIYEASPEFILGKIIRFKDYYYKWGDSFPDIAEHDFPKEMTYDEAILACSKLGEGWRLPSINEYKEIQGWDESYRWNNLKMRYYWTNELSPANYKPGQVKVYDTKSRDSPYQEKNQKFFVRAVKGIAYKN